MTCWNELSLEFTSFHLFSSSSSFFIPFFSLHQLYLRTNWNSVDQNPDGIVFEEKYALLRWIVSVSYNRNLFFLLDAPFFKYSNFSMRKYFLSAIFCTKPFHKEWVTFFVVVALYYCHYSVLNNLSDWVYRRQIIQRIVNLQIIVIF